jgi:hypothetical protein
VENGPDSAIFKPSTFPFSLVSILFLGLLFFTLRNEQIGHGIQKTLVWVFVGHSCICAGISIKELTILPDVNSRMASDIVLFRLVRIFGAVHNFVGALVGMLALHVSGTVLTGD